MGDDKPGCRGNNLCKWSREDSDKWRVTAQVLRDGIGLILQNLVMHKCGKNSDSYSIWRVLF